MAASYDQIIQAVAIDVPHAQAEIKRARISGIGEWRPQASINGMTDDLRLPPLAAMFPDLNSLRNGHQQQRPVAAGLHRQRKAHRIRPFRGIRNDRGLPDDLPDSGRLGSIGKTKLHHSVTGHDEQTLRQPAQSGRPHHAWPMLELVRLLRCASEASLGILIKD